MDDSGGRAWRGESATPVASYLRGVATLEDPTRVIRYTVDHVRDVTGAEWAEFVETRAGRMSVLVSTEPALTAELMRTRIETHEPPDPSDALASQTVLIQDLAVDSPWPAFGRLAAARTPVRSAVLPYVVVADRVSAVMPVFDRRIGHFTPERENYVRLVAALAALTLSRLAALDKAYHLAIGLETRQRVGVAIGILATKNSGLTPDAAFDLLRVTSQHSNRKLRDLAEEVIAAHELVVG
ncbi:MAG: ANTAR domain-containing protein [Actinomycetes bacterium]